MKRILSIDGGGIRGIIPGMFLVALEERLRQLSGKENTHLSEYFDFFAGTSTGGILIALLLCPSEEDPHIPKYNAQQALNLYLEHGTEIFCTSNWRRFLSRFGLLSELYNESTFENILHEHFGETKLSELLKPCIFTAYNIELRKNHLFRQQKAISHGDPRDFYLKDVCRATAAAPTYFSVAETFSIAGTRYPLVDGGVFAHNPSISALIEVLKSYNTFRIDDIHILSLGTGLAKNAYNYEDFKKKWAISIGPALVDIMTSSSSESNDYFMTQLFKSINNAGNYLRIEPMSLSSIDSRLDAADPTNIQKIISLADRMISQNEESLDKLAKELIVDKKNKNQNREKSVWNFLRN